MASNLIACRECGILFSERHHMEYHVQTSHPDRFSLQVNERADERDDIYVTRHNRCLRGFLESFRIDLKPVDSVDLYQVFDNIWQAMRDFLENELVLKQRIKIFVVLDVRMYRTKDDKQLSNIYLSAPCLTLAHSVFIDSICFAIRDVIIKKVDDFQLGGSDWVLAGVNYLYLNTAMYTVHTGGSFIRLPDKIFKKHACINIKGCNDLACFYWSILAGLYPCNTTYKNRILPYRQHLSKLNLLDCPVPMTMDKIDHFAQINDLSISILAVEDQTDKLYPIWTTPGYQVDEKRNLMLVYLQQKGKGHFAYVKSKSRLLSLRDKYNKPRFYCFRCLCTFYNRNSRDTHSEICNTGRLQRLRFFRGRKLTFDDYRAQVKPSFYICFDTEQMILPRALVYQDKGVSYTEKINDLCIVSYAYIVADERGNYVKHKTHFGLDSGQVMLQDILGTCSELLGEYNKPKKIRKFTSAEISRIQQCTNCDLCEVEFSPTVLRYADHSHIIYNELRFILCAKCNQRISDAKIQFAIYAHNLNFDVKYLLQGVKPDMKVDILGRSIDRISGMIVDDCCRFLDSMSLFCCSLDQLASSLLSDSRENFKLIDQVFPGNPHRDMLTRKLYYPYEFFDSIDKYELSVLPPKESFYSSLKGEGITDEAYEFTQDLYSKFQLKNLSEFCMLYNLIDCICLAAGISKFADVTYAEFGLDIRRFFSLPGLAYKGCLKVSKTPIELLSCPTQYGIIQNSLRGGYSSGGGLKFSRANHKYLKSYDPSMPSVWLYYFDCTALYSWAQCQPLPYAEYVWLQERELDDLPSILLSNDFETENYCVTCDLFYPYHLRKQNAHREFPIVIDKQQIDFSQLSEQQKDYLKRHPSLKGPITKKLLATFTTKRKYSCLGSNLAFYMKMGIICTRIHSAFRFKVSRWGAPFIDKCVKIRTEGATPFIQNAGKLIANSCYGRWTLDVSKHLNFQVVGDQDKAMQIASNPNFQSYRILNEDVALMASKKGICHVNTNNLVGWCILELSKIKLIDFFHNIICKQFGSVRVQLIDTDSCIISYFGELDMEEWVKENTGIIFSPKGSKVPGFWKNECSEDFILETCVHRSKAYSIITENDKSIKRLKGISRKTRDGLISHEDYKHTLFTGEPQRHRNVSLRAENFKFHTVVQNKLSLNVLDLKRKQVSPIHTIPFD